MNPAEHIEQYLPICKGFEGCTSWMYRDTAGLVTIGVGCMIPNAAAALKLPFRILSSGDLAGAPAVQADFARVKSLPAGKPAPDYREYESLILRDEDIDVLLRDRVETCDAALMLDFDGYEDFPTPAKIALLDMAFNLGDRKLMDTYPHFDAAVRARNWTLAAQECGRDVTVKSFAARNAWTRQQFLSAA